MTNLDSILKSRDITLPTKFCLVKAMVFPVVMYGCESSGKTRRVYTQLDKGPETPGTTREATRIPFLRQDEA